MKTIVVVSHAQSQHHVDKVVGGWHDTGLTDLGKKQAQLTADKIKEILPTRDVKIYSSDLKRAYETAEVISAAIEIPIVSSEALREISYGEAEGKPQAWLDERFVPPPKSGNRMDHSVCEGAESRKSFAERIYRIMDEIYSTDFSSNVVVSHGFALTFIVSWWIGLPKEKADCVHFASSSAGITVLVEDDRFHNRGVKYLNNIDHLHIK